ncbi:uncharacterized protein LOC132274674 [Cornus florida]|uniref:uncharacterized protein LOC132274674 n=1 Tax=Cornus florida TaxID=4283 RepID=UPI0028984726|nr:uncharacterized protein LOC132274674 [Cornus florida]XP_059631984.1 uncharacterized protein LOC132274674 [Cornus florida]
MSSGSKSTVNLGSDNDQNLISMLRSKFDEVQLILVAREENLKRNINDMSKEIEIWKKEFQLTEKRKCELELAKLEIDDELKKRKRECDELREQVTRSKEDQTVQFDRAKRAEERCAKLLEDFTKAEADKRELLLQVKVKNTDLECANATKRRAEGEVEAWKRKFGELESRVLQLEEETAMLMIRDPLPHSKLDEALKAEQPVSDEKIVKKETCNVVKPQNKTGSGNNGPKQSVSNCHYEVPREGIKEKGTCDDGEFQNGTSVGKSSTNLADTQIKQTLSNSHVSDSGPVIEIDGLQVAGPNSMSRACDNEVLIKKELVFEVESSDKLIGSSVGVNKKPESGVIVEISDSDDEIPIVKEITKRKRALCSNLCLSEDDDDKTLISKHKRKQLQQLSYGGKPSPSNAYRAIPDSGSIDIAKAVFPPRQGSVIIGQCQEKIKAEQNVTNPFEQIYTRWN